MESIAQMILDHLGSTGVSQLSQQVGADPQTTSNAINHAVPVLVSAMAQNARQPQGAQAVHATVQQQSGNLLDDVSGYLQNPQQANGEGMLERILGGQQQGATQGIAQATGLNSTQTNRILAIAAPLVVSYLARQQRQQNLNPGDLAQLLGQHQQQIQQSNPQVGGLIGQLFGG